MGKVRVSAFAISIDGYGAGPNQDLQNPLGVGGTRLHEWFFPTRTFQETVLGKDGGLEDLHNEFAKRSLEGIGAWIMGRNMFGPVRGPWPDENWRGWWGDTPPYHVPVFVLTHHARPTLHMHGGTTFHFTGEPIETILQKARDLAGDRDVRIGGGVSTVRQFLEARLIDELHLVLAPTFLGAGEPLFSGIDLVSLGYQIDDVIQFGKFSHVMVKRADS